MHEQIQGCAPLLQPETLQRGHLRLHSRTVARTLAAGLRLDLIDQRGDGQRGVADEGDVCTTAPSV